MKPKEPIPDPDSIDELARFWDAHDATDYTEDFEEVTEPLFSLGAPASSRPAGASGVSNGTELSAAFDDRAKASAIRGSGLPAGSRRSQQKRP